MKTKMAEKLKRPIQWPNTKMVIERNPSRDHSIMRRLASQERQIVHCPFSPQTLQFSLLNLSLHPNIRLTI